MESPSIVVICLPCACEVDVWHERTALPSMCTVQAPHRPDPQPYLVPVSLRCSRITQSSGVAESSSTLAALPLIVKAIVIQFLLEGVSRFGVARRLFGIADKPGVRIDSTARRNPEIPIGPRRRRKRS